MHHSPASATRGRYTAVTKLFIVQFCCCPSWRLSTARPNVQHGAGATNGIFNPIRWSACVLCVHGRLSAKEELQNIAETRATRSMHRLLMIPPPLNFRAATEKFLLDADIAIVHTQRIRDRQDDSDRLPLSMNLTDSCERRSSVSKCTPEWDEKLSFLATGCPKYM